MSNGFVDNLARALAQEPALREVFASLNAAGQLTVGSEVIAAGGGSASPVGMTLTVSRNQDGTWPERPTSRTDIVVAWKGPDPSPPIVSSGVGGMLDDVDYRLVTP